MESFLLAFIPLFVAIDPIGALPLFLGLTEKFSHDEKRKLALQAVVTALIIGVTFGAVGHVVFSLLGITASDFRVAGGLLLVILSIRDISGMTPKTTKSGPPDNFVGNVPLGIPLIAGPAMLTTLLILHDEHLFFVIVAALISNLLIVLLLFLYADQIVKLIGGTTSKVFAKVVAIFLAAIGVMMIRKGIEGFLIKG